MLDRHHGSLAPAPNDLVEVGGVGQVPGGGGKIHTAADSEGHGVKEPVHVVLYAGFGHGGDSAEALT